MGILGRRTRTRTGWTRGVWEAWTGTGPPVNSSPSSPTSGSLTFKKEFIYHQGCGFWPFWSDPENFHWIRMWSWINKEKYFKNRAFTHFQVNFSIFSDKNNHHSNIRRNMIDVRKKISCLNWFLLIISWVRIRFLKFWFAGTGFGRKWTGSSIGWSDF